MLGKLSLAASVLLCSTVAASATTYTYNFAGATTAVTPTKSFAASPAGGPSVVVQSNTVSNDTLTVTPTMGVGQWAGYGLGMLTAGDNSHTVDGLGGNDLLEFTFSSPVKILSASFYYAGVVTNSNDGFDFYADNDGDASVAGDRVFAHMDIGAVGGAGTYNFLADAFADIFSTTFAFAASWDQTVTYCTRYRYGICKAWGSTTYFDSFKLKSLTIEIPQVPLPASLPLLASVLGFGGFAAWRRRRA